MKKFTLFTVLLVSALLLVACGGTNNAAENVSENMPAENTADSMNEEGASDEMAEEMPERSIAEIAASDENFSTLVTALDAAGLVGTLAGEGNFTVFAPTNDAFAALGDTLNDVLADNDLLTQVLLYHVVDGKVMSPDALALAGSEAETLSGDKIALSIEDGELFINDAMVTVVDIEATNGVIHVIDAVLLPPADEMSSDMSKDKATIADIAAGDENFSTLVTALDAAGLVGTLAGEGNFTVFAPTNDAFAALGDTLNDVIADSELLTQVLLYHVIDGKVMSPDALALAGSEAETLSGDKIALSIEDGDLFINDAMVTAVDIEASNGVIHVIDAVLLPPSDEMSEGKGTIVDIAVSDERFTTLVTALQQAGLVDTLAGEGNFTVFAPTNDAFAALGSDLDAVLADNDLLTQVLLYHVLDGAVMSETAITLDGEEVATLSGDNFAVSVKDGNLYINDSMVIITDIEAENGVIHVIDAVLLPQM